MRAVRSSKAAQEIQSQDMWCGGVERGSEPICEVWGYRWGDVNRRQHGNSAEGEPEPETLRSWWPEKVHTLVRRTREIRCPEVGGNR